MNKKGQFIAGIVAMTLGLGTLVGITAIHFVNEGAKFGILSGDDNFILYNSTVAQEMGYSEDSELVPLEEYEESTKPTDLIASVSKDQEVTKKKDTVVFEIPDLDIKVPVLEGVDDDILAQAAGHFPNTGKVGEGNYCIAGHSSNVYACIFNNLKDVEVGMKMKLTSKKGKSYTYYVTENFVVDPDEVWVLDECFDNRITIVTCTDGGLRRQIVVGLRMSEKEYKNYIRESQTGKRMEIVGQAQQFADIKISEYLKGVFEQ